MAKKRAKLNATAYYGVVDPEGVLDTDTLIAHVDDKNTPDSVREFFVERDRREDQCARCYWHDRQAEGYTIRRLVITEAKA